MDQVTAEKEVTSINPEEPEDTESQKVEEKKLPTAADVGVARPLECEIPIPKSAEIEVDVEAPVVKEGTLPQASDVGKLGKPLEIKEEPIAPVEIKPEEKKVEEYKVLIKCNLCKEEFKVPVSEYEKGVTKCKYCGAINSLTVIEGKTLLEREKIEQAPESKTLYITNKFLSCSNCNIRWLEKNSKACPRCGNDTNLTKTTEEVPYART